MPVAIHTLFVTHEMYSRKYISYFKDIFPQVINSSVRYLFVTINFKMINFGHRILTQRFRKCSSGGTILYINCNFKTRLILIFEDMGRVLCHTYNELYVLTLLVHQIRIILLQYLIFGWCRPYWLLLLTLRHTINSRTISKNTGTFSMTNKSIYIDKKQHLKSQFGSFLLKMAAIILSSIATSADVFTKYTGTNFVQRTFSS